MKKYTVLLILVIFATQFTVSQSDTAQRIQGVVLYKNTPVPNENVINVDTEIATATDAEGEFAIAVNKGDKLAFTAMNYELKTVEITDEIIQNRRLVVEVNEKVTELDEVIVTPEDRERYIQLKNEEFKSFSYEKDASTQTTNYAIPVSQRGMQYGLNFVNIYKALFKSNSKKDSGKPILPSQVMRQLYDDEFFVVDLKIPQNQIDAFLFYVDDKLPSQELMQRDHEFELIDFLVDQSKNFKAIQGPENP